MADNPTTALRRTQHHNTFNMGGGSYRRQIGNWLNWRPPGGDWRPSAPGLSAVGGPGYSHSSDEAPLQVSARDAMDVGNRWVIRARVAEHPQSWWTLRPIDANAVDFEISEDGLTIIYPGVWDGCDLTFRIGAGRLEKEIRIHDKDVAPAYFEFAVGHAPSQVFDVAHNAMSLTEADGPRRLHTTPAWGVDSATTGPGPDGEQTIRVALTRQPDVAGHRVIRLTPHPDDMATAIGDVMIDPTTIISGTTDIKDTWVYQAFPDNNQGGSGYNHALNDRSRHTMYRVESAALPIGTYTEVRWSYRIALSDAPVDIRRFLSDFVGGTKNNAIEVGSSCWNWLEYDTVTWAGGGAISSSDFDAPSLGSTVVGAPGTTQVTTFNATGLGVWQGWESGAYPNKGFIVYGTGVGGGRLVHRSSESGTGPPTFEIDYAIGVRRRDRSRNRSRNKSRSE